MDESTSLRETKGGELFSELNAAPEADRSPARALPPHVALAVPFALTVLLACFGLLPRARESATIQWSLFGAALLLLVWNAILLVTATIRGRKLSFEVMIRKQHWVQGAVIATLFLYWGFYWRPAYDWAWLLVAQIVFAFAFTMLLGFSHRDSYRVGFGPLPITLSHNFFLWFRPDWFYLQLPMLMVSFLAKEFIQWKSNGRKTHIFNPSAFSLSLFALGLLVTGTSSITFGREIATTLFYPPYIYVALFVMSLPGQFVFGVASMTLPAVLTVWLFSTAYYAATGTFFFFDSYIPIAVFLGMQFLFTDPLTAPRTEGGRIIFGVLYGLGVVFAYWVLGALGVPTFYDKLLPVPILNLCVPWIDRLARSPSLKWFDPSSIGKTITGRKRNVAYMGLYAVIFAPLAAIGGLGDTQLGNRLPFWQQACKEGRRNACRNLATMESTFCNKGIGWACNELGIEVAEGRITVEAAPSEMFRRACDARFAAGCFNRTTQGAVHGDAAYRHQPPMPDDYTRMLEKKGFPAPDTEPQLFRNACDQGWNDGCASLAYLYLNGAGVPRNVGRAVPLLEKVCAGGDGSACSNLGLLYRRGDGVAPDPARALSDSKAACDLGIKSECVPP